MDYYWIVNIVLGIIVFCDLKTAYYKGFIRMLVNLMCWLGSFALSVYAAFILAEAYPIEQLAVYTQDFEWIQPVCWFLICFLCLRGLYHILNILIPYGRSKGIFSFANHMLGFAAGLVIVMFNLILLCLFLRSGIVLEGNSIVEHTWLYYIDQLLPYIWNGAVILISH